MIHLSIHFTFLITGSPLTISCVFLTTCRPLIVKRSPLLSLGSSRLGTRSGATPHIRLAHILPRDRVSSLSGDSDEAETRVVDSPPFRGPRRAVTPSRSRRRTAGYDGSKTNARRSPRRADGPPLTPYPQRSPFPTPHSISQAHISPRWSRLPQVRFPPARFPTLGACSATVTTRGP